MTRSALVMLRPIYRALVFGRWDIELVNPCEELRIVRTLRDDYLARCGRDELTLLDRSYLQYRSQMTILKPWRSWLLGLLSLLALPGILLMALAGRLVMRVTGTPAGAVFVGGAPDLIPHGLYEEFREIRCAALGPLALDRAAVGTLLDLALQHPLHPFLLAKVAAKLCQYSFVLRRHSAGAVIASAEFTFASSTLTHYLRRRGVRHLNVMHGEKLIERFDSFFCFDRCFVWHEHYSRLFVTLGACKEQFELGLPPAMTLGLSPKATAGCPPMLIYYLGAESQQQLERLAATLKKFRVGWQVRVRVHPRLSDRKLVRQLLHGCEIEWPESVSLRSSLEAADIVVSTYSTVLLQAHLSGRDIAIDDMTRPGLYERLRDLGYIVMDLPHSRLSALLHANR